MSASTEILLIAIVTATACALPGVFLVLRQMAMMSDAISHTVLLGIVLGFFVLQDLDSPWLIPAAALMGVITVFLVEMFVNTRLVKEDAAIGIVFPALFSIAVILISRYASGVHLDSDAVLLGQLEFAFFDRTQFLGIDIAHSLVVMGIILLVNVVLLLVFYKELKISTFDAGLAAALGFSPVLIHYGLMMMVSITNVVVSRDLSVAKLHITLLGAADERANVVETLNNAAPMLRKLLGRVLRLRNVPSLAFHYDEVVERGAELSELINKKINILQCNEN